MKKIQIDSLVIELTRRCNMKCEHCLRGNTQNIDIDLNYVESLFKKLNYISSLTLSGGEPSLVPNDINHIIEIAKKYQVEIGNFYIATNGKKVSNEFLLALINLWTYCSDNEISQINVSNDEYHEMYENEANKLRVFSFTSNKFEKDYYRYQNGMVIADGRALEFGSRFIKPDLFIIDDNMIQDGNVYLNCKGNIIAGCDFSYKSQNKKENIICKVEDFGLDKFNNFLYEG